MKETSYTVSILNDTLGVGEKIARIGSIEGSSLFRKASLLITNEKIQLGCTDDVGSTHDMGSLSQQSIARIKYKKSVFTPFQQLIKPAMNGIFIGIAAAVVMWFKVGGSNVVGIGQSILITIGLVLFIMIVLIVLNLGKVVWSHLAVVVFESLDGKSVEIAIENGKVDALIASFKEHNIPIGAL